MKVNARWNPGCSEPLPAATHRPGEQPDHQSEVKFKSYSRCHAEVKQHKAGSLKRQEYISFPFTLFILPNAEWETEKNKNPPGSVFDSQKLYGRMDPEAKK